ncbi:hypothetical protein PR048_000980 [Dryococelus australis]|uniref:Uncharacterized protein n=1 Tax=Dryococelus australis TaxID=614101 RepID=A0ABQ9IHD8_9NEOP|nr:hypothetical protein PR048_000980 [Dryococelus australis]
MKVLMWALARAWDSIFESTLNNASTNCGRRLFTQNKMKITLLTSEDSYAKTITSSELTDFQENNIEERFTLDCDVPVVQHYTNEDILEVVTNKNNKDKNSSEDSDENEPAENENEPSEKITQDE